MDLKALADADLLLRTKNLIQTEREVLTKVLHHLREIDRRKLYSDLGCSSLFDYAVKHLKYSGGQAGRRIQAVRLLKEIPELEAKIESGALSLSNISQAQGFFRDAENESAPLDKAQKLEVLELLEHKSAREGERELLRLNPEAALPKEKERVLSEEASEMRFVISADLKTILEEVKTLLGPKGAQMNFAELVKAMSEISRDTLKEKKFGKKRVQAESAASSSSAVDEKLYEDSKIPMPLAPAPPPASEWVNPRYISKKIQHLVWSRDHGVCQKCASTKNLNVDHIVPVAHGGKACASNLRLLCFTCNQRAGIKIFGTNAMARRKTNPATGM